MISVDSRGDAGCECQDERARAKQEGVVRMGHGLKLADRVVSSDHDSVTE
jgi:hypothetical protein